MPCRNIILSILAVFIFFTFPASAVESRSIPVLCYHQVTPEPKGLFELSVNNFREQLSLLKARGYASLNSQNLLDYLSGRHNPVGKPVMITFDDGFRSVYDYAFPIMKEFGFIGVLCVYPSFIGAGNAMTWEQINEMIQAGWSVESHSMTHANIIKDTPTGNISRQAFFTREIIESGTIIERKTGCKPLFMVWPYGIYTRETLEFAGTAGYAGSLTVDGGANYRDLDPFLIKRQVIYKTDDRQKFLIRLEMGALKVTDHSPAPGQVMKELRQIECKIPDLLDYSVQNYVLNVKIGGGAALKFDFDPVARRLTGTLNKTLKTGQYFIDVYLRDKRTGITCQHGWLFSIVK